MSDYDKRVFETTIGKYKTLKEIKDAIIAECNSGVGEWTVLDRIFSEYITELEQQLAEKEDAMHQRIGAEYDNTIAESWKAKLTERDELLDEFAEAIKNLTGNNTPTAYLPDDDVGYCPYCQGWNLHHTESCEIVIAESLLTKLQEREK